MLITNIFIFNIMVTVVYGGCKQYQVYDCQHAREIGFTQSGVYRVTPLGTANGIDVYCDMDTDGGGWLVFQRRQDGSVEFYNDWKEYYFGFGNVTGEYWLGNLALYILLLQGHYELRVDLEDWEGNTTFAEYNYFKIHGPEQKFKLSVYGYSGSAGDSLCDSNGMYFSTKDVDNDNSTSNCAVGNHGAWWYNSCYKANLNGQYREDPNSEAQVGIKWYDWRGFTYSLKKTEMKFRRIWT